VRTADKLDLSIHVSHLPPGTTKWNKVEHRLFSFISIDWRGRPLGSYETVINLIANTTSVPSGSRSLCPLPSGQGASD
jgi:hypothetical protein